jgi:hypothetical protein
LIVRPQDSDIPLDRTACHLRKRRRIEIPEPERRRFLDARGVDAP